MLTYIPLRSALAGPLQAQVSAVESCHGNRSLNRRTASPLRDLLGEALRHGESHAYCCATPHPLTVLTGRLPCVCSLQTNRCLCTCPLRTPNSRQVRHTVLQASNAVPYAGTMHLRQCSSFGALTGINSLCSHPHPLPGVRIRDVMRGVRRQSLRLVKTCCWTLPHLHAFKAM